MDGRLKFFLISIGLLNSLLNYASTYNFENGFPTLGTISKSQQDTLLNRAIEAYKFFYPSVSISAVWDGNVKAGMIPNKTALLMQGNPKQLVFTPNSDTPYGGVNLDLTQGPIVVEIPPGALMGVVNDMNQRYVMDIGLPGPDKGQGGRHLIIPPGYKKKIPSGYYTGTSSTNYALLMVRAIPPQGDRLKAIQKLKTIKVYPLNQKKMPLKWIDIGMQPIDFTPVTIEKNINYWKKLHEIVNFNPSFEPYRMNYGNLAALGIEKGKPFAPSPKLQSILIEAAELANEQLRVQSFADQRPERLPWSDRYWEWATLRPENGTFDLSSYKDLEAREKWFYQAQIESPAMFRRTSGAGSLYWLGLKDNKGHYLDGSKNYKLIIPLPVPAKLFWSITVYDPITRSEMQNDQNKAALRSLEELKNMNGTSVTLYFGPNQPKDKKEFWIQTQPGKGWFCYLRLYGPEKAAFNGTWKPDDIEINN